jgi:hypothetical protein
MTDGFAYSVSATSLSARAFSQGDSFVPRFAAVRWYPASSSGVQRNRASLVAGSGLGGLPGLRLGFFMGRIMRLQKLVDKAILRVYSVATLTNPLGETKCLK